MSVFENDDCSFGNEADLQSHRRLSILGRLEKWGYVEQIMASDKKGSNSVLQKHMTDVGYIGIIGLRVGPRRREELSEQRELCLCGASGDPACVLLLRTPPPPRAPDALPSFPSLFFSPPSTPFIGDIKVVFTFDISKPSLVREVVLFRVSSWDPPAHAAALGPGFHFFRPGGPPGLSPVIVTSATVHVHIMSVTLSP